MSNIPYLYLKRDFQKMAKIQRYEPWGYMDESGYVSRASQIREEKAEQRALDEKQNKDIEDVQNSAVSEVRYNSADKTIEFLNEKGKVVGRIPVTDIIGDGMIESAYYDSETEEIVIDFGKNSQGEEVVVRIYVGDLIDLNEFKDGLEVISGNVYVKVDSTSDQVKIDSAGTLADVLTVSEDGVKVNNIAQAIQVEEDRAKSVEAYLQEEIDNITSGGSVEELKHRVEELEAYVAQLKEVITLNISGSTKDMLLYIEDDWLSANDLLAQLAHETYNSTNGNNNNNNNSGDSGEY